MKYIISFILLLSCTYVYSQDSTHARWVDGSWEIEVHPDSVVGTDLNVGPKTAYKTTTGEYYVYTDSVWSKLASIQGQYGATISDFTESEWDRIETSGFGPLTLIDDAVLSYENYGGTSKYLTFYVANDTIASGNITFGLDNGLISITNDSSHIRMTNNGNQGAQFRDYRNIDLGIQYLNMGGSNSTGVGQDYTNFYDNSLITKGFVKGVQGTGTPSGSVTPLYIAQIYQDTSVAPIDIYMATGETNTDWKLISD